MLEVFFIILHYLNGYEDIAKSFAACFKGLSKDGVAVFSQIPDITLKEKHIASYTTLPWPKERIDKAVAFEREERFWISFEKLETMAKDIGFRSISKERVPQQLFLATHMFDLVLKK